MNIVQLNNFIEKIVSCTETVKSFYTNSVYECWNTEEVKYGSISFCITKTQMRERTMTYDAIIYYGDRLLEDKSNRNAIWSDATQVIQSIIGTVNSVDGEITISYPYNLTLFEQKFADELAGAYAEISIEVEGVGECGDLLYGYEDEEGVKLESIVKTFTINGEYDIVPSDGFDAISDVKVIVDVPIQSKSVEFNSNGSYNVTPDNEYAAMDNVNVNVNIALQAKSVTYSEVGDYQVTPDPGYEALSKVNVKVSLEGKPKIPNGFVFTGGDMSLVEWDKYDWSMVYDTAYFFKGCTFNDPRWADRFNSGFNGRVMSGYSMFENCSTLENTPDLSSHKLYTMEHMFSGCSKLKSISMMDTSEVVDASYAFNQCDDLQSIPQLDFSSVRDATGMFDGCIKLTTLDELNFLSLNNTEYMFNGCTNLISVPRLNTSNVTDFTSMFRGCGKITTIPQLDFSSATSVQEMFKGCTNLISVPRLNTSNVTMFDSMFEGCKKLTTVPEIDFSSAIYTQHMFQSCYELTTIPKLNTSNIQYMGSMFYGCRNLTAVTQLDISNATNLYQTFAYCSKLNEVRFKGKPQPSITTGYMFSGITTNGTLYYDSRYDYSKIINVLPSTWTAVPYDVVE